MSTGCSTYQEVDDAVFEHLRREVIAQGYYPDLTLFQPENPANRTAFRVALEAIVTGGKTPINTVGNGVFAGKGEMKLNTMYIHRVSTTKGSIAVFDIESVRTDGLTTPPDANTTYERIATQGFTEDIEYEVRFVADTQANADLISNIIALAIKFKRYLDIFDLSTGLVVPDKKLLLEFVGSQDLDLFDFKEFVFRFTALDVWVVTGSTLPNGTQTVVNPNIVPIIQIDDELEIN